MDPQTAKMILEECLIMRKYEMTLDRALPSVSKNERLEAMLQISKGLADLHGMGIAHRDVHLNNMMYDTRRNAWYLIDVTSPLTSKETEEDDIRYLMMCITEEVLKDDSILIAELKGLSHPLASDSYKILIRHSR